MSAGGADVVRIEQLSQEIRGHAEKLARWLKMDTDTPHLVALIGLETMEALEKIGEALELVAWQIEQARR